MKRTAFLEEPPWSLLEDFLLPDEPELADLAEGVEGALLGLRVGGLGSLRVVRVLAGSPHL